MSSEVCFVTPDSTTSELNVFRKMEVRLWGWGVGSGGRCVNSLMSYPETPACERRRESWFYTVAMVPSNASNMGPLQSLFPLWRMILLQKYEDPTPFQISCHWLSCLISVVKSSPLTLFKMATVHYPSPTLWQSLIPLDSLCFLNPLDLPKYCV